jgi:hypothetical protein
LACRDQGLLSIDVSKPGSPSLIRREEDPDFPVRLIVDRNRLYVADYNRGMQVFDVSRPATPRLSGRYRAETSAFDIAVEGDTACLATASALEIIDVSDPAAPVRKGLFDLPSIGRSVSLSNKVARVRLDSALLTIDLSDPQAPVQRSKSDGIDQRKPDAPMTDFKYEPPLADANDVFIADKLAYVADGATGLRIIDISDPADPILCGICRVPGSAQGIIVFGSRAYVATRFGGLHVVDVSKPTNPILLSNNTAWPKGSSGVSGSGNRIAAAGNLVFVASSGDLSTYDISGPSAPILRGPTGSLPGLDARGIAAAGSLAYVAILEDLGSERFRSGLRIIDFTSPTAAIQLGSFDVRGIVQAIAVSGNIACLLDEVQGMSVIDVSRPEAPVFLGQYYEFNSPTAVTIAGDIAWVGYGGLRAIDISDPSHPRLSATLPVPSFGDLDIRAISVAGDLVYLACGEAGLVVVRFQNPAH